MSVSGINAAQPVYKPLSSQSVKNVTFKANEDAPKADTVEIAKEEKPELTNEEKQKMLKHARQKAAGWALFGGIFSTLYYGLRSNKTIAEKFNLDPQRDKDLIKQIKNDQTVWTLPGAFLPFAGGLIAYIIACNKNSKNIEID